MPAPENPRDYCIAESARLWRDRLIGEMPSAWAEEIDNFEIEIQLKKQGKLDDKVFAESRLRRGVYGQRYDNGFRHNGRINQPIPYSALTKGPMTKWDAPGMQRIKIPWGGMNPEQMAALADLAEEYSDGICHVTTRQDIQLHYVHIEDTPSLFRRLAAVGITTREACGNSVRNVTACPLAGVCHDEVFDVTPYADAMFRYLLGHPDVQDFGRKFKIAFSGCQHNACGLTFMHDLGLIATKRVVNGQEKRGFKFYVGGGLGAVPFQAKLLQDFVVAEELLPLTQAVCRIYARHGEKKKRNRARIKFLVNDLGIEEFKRLVLAERAKLVPDPRWRSYLSDLDRYTEAPGKPAGAMMSLVAGDFKRWVVANVRAQRQSGYAVVTLALPLGDITANQMRDLAALSRRFVGDTVRTTVEQNIVLRWVAQSDLYELYGALKQIDLVGPYANTIVDVTSCPGTDTCKLGVASSRGLAGELRAHLAGRYDQMDPDIRSLKIKMSGCFNSCGQHHIADIGFFGVSRKVGNYVVPHFQLVLGGQMEENAGSYGLAVTALPSKNIPKVVERLESLYLQGRQEDESFQKFINRLGKAQIKQAVSDLAEVPFYDQDPSFYVDWGDVRTYSTQNIGAGECAGEVISLIDFGLKEADRELFAAQTLLENGDFQGASARALAAMVTAAHGLLKGSNPDVPNEADFVVAEFRRLFCDTALFLDPFAGDKFANYFFKACEQSGEAHNADSARKLVEEAVLFIEAAHACNVRMSMSP